MVRFAVVGTNFITDYLLQASKSCPDFKLMGVHSRSEERARAYALEKGAELYYTDLDTLAACPEIDAVYIATPNFTHKDYALKMLRAGKHVLLEKPITVNEGELKELMEEAEKRGLVVMEALRAAFNPDFRAIREALPKLGVLRRAMFSCSNYSRRYDNFKKGVIENAFIPEMANGALMDLGVYTVNYMTGLFGEPQDLTASVMKLHNGLDGVGTITAAYETMLVTLFYCKVHKSANFAEICGEEGYMVIEGLNNPQKATIYYNDGRVEELPLMKTPFREDLSYELAFFIDCIKNKTGGEKEQNRRSLASMRVMDQARKLMGMHFPNDDAYHMWED